MMDIVDRIEKGEIIIEAYGNKDGISKICETELLRLAKLGKQFEKLNITETIARNCTAWDTSKDRTSGILPEVYWTNRYLYEKLVGEDYNFSKACKKFHIGRG